MKQFFKLNRNIRKGDVYIERSEVPKYIEDAYTEGIQLAPIRETLKFFYRYKTNLKTDYLAGSERYPIISDKFRNILVDISPEFLEFFPVQIVCEKTNEIDASYYFLNILHNIPCFDWEQSDYGTLGFDDIIIKVSKLVIKPDFVKERDIFRIKELPELIFISEKLRTILEREAISGMEFINIEDVTLG
ncbi:MAG TPA: DUF1629 domain-containing protein [Bacillota bacterium]|nr:DUF1629 domain-containing protein [Bacillota bacterium]